MESLFIILYLIGSAVVIASGIARDIHTAKKTR